MALGEEWAMLTSDSDDFRIMALRARLESEGIQVIVLNLKDSNYAFGNLELHVRKEEFIKARAIFDSHNP